MDFGTRPSSPKVSLDHRDGVPTKLIRIVIESANRGDKFNAELDAISL
jgi:hypothetical protein